MQTVVPVAFYVGKFANSPQKKAVQTEQTTTSDYLEKTKNAKRRGSLYPARGVECLRKILLIGEPTVGKTSFRHRYVHGGFTLEYKATQGVDFALKVVKWTDDMKIKLQLWDIAGQERFCSMTRVYYRDAHACIIMFDLTQKQTFLRTLQWKKDLDSKCRLPDGSPVPCVLLGNKSDLHNPDMSAEEIEEFWKKHNFTGYAEISVKEDLMVQESMNMLLEEVMARCAPEEASQEQEDHEKKDHIQLREKPSNLSHIASCSCNV